MVLPLRDALAPTTAEAAPHAAEKVWLENWKTTAPLLERERWERLASLSDEQVRGMVLSLFALWQPDWPSDNGEALLRHRRVFARVRTSA